LIPGHDGAIRWLEWKYYGQFAGNGHACLLEARHLGQLHAPCPQRGEAQVACQQGVGRLVEVLSGMPIALLGDASVVTGLTILVAPGRQAEIKHPRSMIA